MKRLIVWAMIVYATLMLIFSLLFWVSTYHTIRSMSVYWNGKPSYFFGARAYGGISAFSYGYNSTGPAQSWEVYKNGWDYDYLT